VCPAGDEFGEPIIPERKIRIGALFRLEHGDDANNQADDARMYAWLFLSSLDNTTDCTCRHGPRPKCQMRTEKIRTRTRPLDSSGP
jgi:hypothetical protein